jgi:amino acid adenylation domain-containing protein
MMDTGEREFVVHGCNRTRARYPEGSCVHEVFAEVAAACPEASALSGADGTFTYRELDRWSDAVARRLEASGLGPEARAGILLPRSAGAVAAILGVLKAGGAYVPLDPSHPRDRLARILEDSGARALVTRGGIDAGWVPGSVPVLDLERIPRDGGRAAARPARAFPDGLAYVMYTSGSTGRPKGVLVTHRNVTRLVRGAGYADLGPGETILMFAPLSFDASTFEIWGALLNGGRLAVAPPGALAPRELAAFAAREGVTTLWMTAPLFHATADGPIAALAGLRQLLAGGDVLAPGSVRKAAAALPGCRIVNGYGPTEATTFTCAYAVPADGPPPGNVPIGAPIGNARVVILDDRMEPVPVGVPGQIYIGGDGLARGYLGSPDLTASRFVPDPLSGDPGARLYASGDRGRRLPDGTIEFLGRIDRQVKVRGFRIEPAEIEAALRGHPDVSEALVVLRGDLPGGGGLAAYVVSRGTAPAAQDLRRFLEARLPSHMIPAAFAAIDAVPLTPSGKVDRASLPAPAPAPDGPGAPPGTPLEATIAFVWREILRLPAVDRDDGFFDLGGHSLLAMQVVARLRDALGVDLTLARFFEAPTVAGLAAAVEEARGAVSGPAPPPVARSARGGPVPLSSAQRRLWVLHQVEPASAFYNVHAAARLEGRLDVEALRRALTELVRRHEALRTTFATVDGDPVQVVADPAPVRLEVADLTALPAASREARALAAASAEARRPFDLETGPLLRASLQRLGAEDHVLAITIHHLAADGWSLGIVFRELRTLYAAFAAGRPSPLPEPELQYRDYALWQRAWLSGEILGAQIAYWRDRLAGAPDLLALPADRPRPKHLSFRGGSRRFTVPGPLAARLEELGRREGATLFMTLLAAFKVWISRHAGEEDVVVGAPVAGRGRPELDGIVGFFANTLALRTDLSGNPPFGEVLRRVRGTALQAYARQDAPFEQVVEALRVRRDPGRAPVFQVMFDLQNAPGADLDLPGLGALPIDVETGTAKFDLHVSVAPEGGALAGLVEYAADLFDPETIDRMLGRFLTLLESASADPATPILDLPMIPDGELRRIRSAERGAAAPDPAGTPVHLLFEARAARSPEAIAVDGEDGRLTYRELDARSSGLARELRRLGVGPDVAAGIFMERSPEMVVAILGVLKAGGAYLPLDPSYPEERIAFMRRDAACPVILAGRGTVEGIRPDGAAVVEVDAFREAPGSGEAGPAGRPAGPESLAYVLYTSGSTGRPKGVMVPHRALANHMGWMLGTFPMTAEDRVLQRTPAVFDASVWEFFAPLLSGARLVLAPSGAHHDTSRLARALASERITTLQLVPSLLALLLEEIGLEACRDLRLVFCGGEPLAPELRDRFVARLGIPLHNLYGPTEACIDATWWSCLPGDGGRTVPVGRPIAGMRALVLDGRLRPSPIGVIGELHLGGEGLARGYLGRPDLTAGSFLPDPRGPRPGSRLYATGDRARRLPDGTIELLGRRDDQVKLRGVRIEPAEVEAVLAEHPEVREAAVVVREDEPGRPYLAAYVAPRDGRTPTPATLRAALRDRLPGAMVPSTFVALPALPRTPGGKVDRRSLPAPERRAGGAGEPPLTPVEEAIGRIWSGVLGRGAFGPGDDFFEAGGHSLLAVQVRHRIREVFQVEVPFRVFFEATTLRELARAVAAAGRSPEEAEAIARIFLRVESLSPEEVRGALEEPAAAGGGG